MRRLSYASGAALLQPLPTSIAGPRRGKLPELARAGAITAETQAIQQTLDRLRWNRRKPAQQLGVSYKTLLTQMKECGIRTPAPRPKRPEPSPPHSATGLGHARVKVVPRFSTDSTVTEP